MKTLKKMALKEKLICLFNLMPEEFGGLTEYIRSTADAIGKGRARVDIAWLNDKMKNKQAILAHRVMSVLNRHFIEISEQAKEFAEHLLSDELKYFTLYCIAKFVREEKYEGTEFSYGAQLFLL